MHYIVFKDNADDYLDEYEGRLHLGGLTLALASLAALLLASLYLTRRLSTPLSDVARKVGSLTMNDHPVAVEAPFVELRAIELALSTAQRDVALHIRREQEFSRFVSHELRTPLTIVSGSAETLARLTDEGGLRGPGARAVDRIGHACRTMALLIETFLMLGKRDDDDDHERRVRLDVATLLAETDAQVRDTLGKRDTWPIRISGDDASMTVMAPEVLMRVLLDNLVRNAFHHASGPIDVQVRRGVLTVDNPVDPESVSASGHGYGLVICQRICERMGWRFEVNSETQRFRVAVIFANAGNPRSL